MKQNINVKKRFTCRWNLGGAIDFNQKKLMKILNEMDRSKTAYILNSNAPKKQTPDNRA
jgi:hypothetical protein